MVLQARPLLFLNADCCTLIMEVVLRNKKDQLAIVEHREDGMCSSIMNLYIPVFVFIVNWYLI